LISEAYIKCMRTTLKRTATQCNAKYCNTPQYTSTHYTILQHTTIHCNKCLFVSDTLRGRWCRFQRRISSVCATHCNTLQRAARRCNTLQRAATRWNVLEHAATRCATLHAATRFLMLQHISLSLSLSLSFSLSLSGTLVGRWCSFQRPISSVCATHYTTLQRAATLNTATRCNLLQHTWQVVSISEAYIQVYERHTATHCNTLQHVATRCNAKYCNTLQSTATHLAGGVNFRGLHPGV